MYLIITENEKVLRAAKEEGAKIISLEEANIKEEHKNNTSNEISPDKVQNFLNGFVRINKDSLGYNCVKYILENNIECNFETRDEVIAKLAQKYNTTPPGIACALTSFSKRVRRSNFAPEGFKDFYHNTIQKNACSVGERAIELIYVFQKYLQQN